jgi:hypothetical protein
MKKILVLIAAACSVGLGQAHAVSVVNWELTDFDNDGKRSDFSFAAAPSGMSALKFGYSGETGCTNAPDGNHCVPIITDGRSYLADVFTTGFDFTGNNVYFKPNLEIPGGIRADITNNTLTFSVLNWAGRFPGATGAQFFIPPNDKQLIDDPNDPNQQIEIGTIDPSFVNVETLTDLGGGRYGVVVRWIRRSRILGVCR